METDRLDGSGLHSKECLYRSAPYRHTSNKKGLPGLLPHQTIPFVTKTYYSLVYW